MTPNCVDEPHVYGEEIAKKSCECMDRTANTHFSEDYVKPKEESDSVDTHTDSMLRGTKLPEDAAVTFDKLHSCLDSAATDMAHVLC